MAYDIEGYHSGRGFDSRQLHHKNICNHNLAWVRYGREPRRDTGLAIEFLLKLVILGKCSFDGVDLDSTGWESTIDAEARKLLKNH